MDRDDTYHAASGVDAVFCDRVAVAPALARSDTSEFDVRPSGKAARTKRTAPVAIESAVIVATDPGDIRSSKRALSSLCDTVTVMDCFETGLIRVRRSVRSQTASFGLVVVQIDDFGGIGECIEPLLDFRRRCPVVPVILLSREVTTDDLSLERLPIGDVTLCSAGRAPWETAIAIAIANNRAWQARCNALRGGETRKSRQHRRACDLATR